RTVQLTQSLLEKIGLSINPSKSAAIHIQQGKLAPGEIIFGSGITIKAIGAEERIRYLGCNFNDEIVFDKNIAVRFTNKINKLITSPLLKMQQKINKIGRASCRERVEISEVDVGVKKKKNRKEENRKTKKNMNR